MTKPLAKREKAGRRRNAADRARERRQYRDYERALDALVKAGLLRALEATCLGIRQGNPEMTTAAVCRLGMEIMTERHVIDRALDAAHSTMVEEELPSAAEAVRLVAEAAEKAALETFTLRHKLPMGRA